MANVIRCFLILEMLDYHFGTIIQMLRVHSFALVFHPSLITFISDSLVGGSKLPRAVMPRAQKYMIDSFYRTSSISHLI
jgi:hypothetical protein